MEHPTLLSQLLILIAFAIAGAALFERLRLPPIAAFLVVGAVVGPGGFGLVSEAEEVRALAELGVVLLLFEVGLELPLERVRTLWRSASIAGALQVAGTVALVALGAPLFGLSSRDAVIMGGLIAMSSTALVMRLLSERGEIGSPHGQLVVGILLFQDLCIVPLLLFLPVLAAPDPEQMAEALLGVGRSFVVLVLFFAGARFLLPRLLDQAVRATSREVFTLLAFLIVLGSAVIAERTGLTLAVGAFVGGLVLSASPYAHQLFAEVVPLRDVLLGIFFTAVGMFLDPRAALEHAPSVALYLGSVVVLKAGIVLALVVGALRLGVRLGVLSGLALAQTGEFSFVLASAAADYDLVDPVLHQVFVAGSIATLIVTPFLVRIAPVVARTLAPLETEPDPVEAGWGELSDHAVLVGFGLAGRSLARVLRARGIPYVVVDANAPRVVESRKRGEPIFYGDATRRPVLERLGVTRARLVVAAISDARATRELVELVHMIAPQATVVARTRRVEEVDELQRAGAHATVVEEFETSIELLARALQAYGVPESAVARFLGGLREEGYEALRAPTELQLDPWLTELLEHVTTEWIEVPAAWAARESIGALAIRSRTGANVLVVERAGTTIPNPDASFVIEPGDRLLAAGEPEAIVQLRRLFEEAAMGAAS